MQIILPRATLLLISVAVAIFCYYESVYYADHSIVLATKSADVRIWMWVFRTITLVSAVFALALVTDLIRKLFF